MATTAAADDDAPFVTQLRLPARERVVEVFAWRSDQGVIVDASALQSLGINTPNASEPVPLSSIPGLTYAELDGEAAIVLTCTVACFAQQYIDLSQAEQTRPTTSARGGYLNYEVDAQWVDGQSADIAGIAEAALFGDWGLIESSAIAQTGADKSRFTRLETSWTIDPPGARIRAKFGDSTLTNAAGAPVRFGGFQIGRYFGLTPSLITHPTPTLTGEAETASTVQLYVDGTLRAQTQIEAGPFAIDHPPVVSGSGEAELVITDVLGRQQIITRPFFVSTTQLRKGLSDWSVAAGALRREFGVKSFDYDDAFAGGRYRYGLTDALTIETALEHVDGVTTARVGATFATLELGQVYLAHASNAEGGATTAAWLYDARAWSIGLQFEQRDPAFRPLGYEENDFRRGVATNVALDLGDYGALSFTAAQVDFESTESARTLMLSYSPDLADGALSFRLLHTESEESALSAGVAFSFAFGDDGSAHLSAESDRGALSFRASAQQSVTPERLGWRARVSVGNVERVDAAVQARTPLGDSLVQVAHVDGALGARLRHSGSVGWIENVPFAGRRIEGAFAVVDAGAPDVSVSHNRLNAGVTGEDGRKLVTNLRPYGINEIAIDADDLPFDRAPATPESNASPAEGAGVLVRFADARQRLVNTNVRYRNGSFPSRGAILLRQRDGERFPVGSEGRVVLTGAQDGDIVTLNNSVCYAIASEAAAARGLELMCEAS